MAELSPERILITGSSGFVGKHLIPACRIRYPTAEIYGLSHVEIDQDTSFPYLIPMLADIRDQPRIREILNQVRPEIVIHLAGQASVAASWEDPAETLAINTGGTLALFQAMINVGIAPRTVLIGSGDEYGAVEPDENPITEMQPLRPLNPYAVSKAAQDMYGAIYHASHNLPIVRARAFNHFGPYQLPIYVIASFAQQIAAIEAGHAEPIIRVGNLNAQRDFLPVQDVVGAYLALAETGHPGDAYNVGSGIPRTIEEVLNMLLALSTAQIEIVVEQSLFRPIENSLTYPDISRTRNDTGWSPVKSFESGLSETLNYWRASVSANRQRSLEE